MAHSGQLATISKTLSRNEIKVAFSPCLIFWYIWPHKITLPWRATDCRRKPMI